MSELNETLQKAVLDGQLLESSLQNIRLMLERARDPLYESSIRELAEAGEWSELNDRFFRTLAFGTGGLRGKTISTIVTKAEQGTPQALGRPEFPCVGTNAMNTYNVSRATQGLAHYVKEWFDKNSLPGNPSVCISYDTRHFSKEFAALAAKVLVENGVNALLFEGPRSTPELSFAVRMHRATAGINITASHNPPPYNGYKVYFDDGGQVVEPHASAIIEKVNAVESEEYTPLPPEDQGNFINLGRETDEEYLKKLETILLDPEMVAAQNTLKIVYTPIHGTGSVIIKPLLERLGFNFSPVPEQDEPDGRFPTVKAPNPEYPQALEMAIAQANREGADIVLATDPDDDRLGCAVRGDDGEMHLLTGNQIGSLMAWYRSKTFFEKGILDAMSADRGVIIKTFVTTDLQKAIADSHHLRCVETLTGFKYIGAKLKKYELAIPEELRDDYNALTEDETRKLRIEHSALYVFGGEESYGYSGADFVHDKDGNSAVAMLAEVAAYAKSQDMTLLNLLDLIFAEYGVFLERGESLVYDGAEGAAKIARLVESYQTNPPDEIDGYKVTGMKNFAKEDIYDVEGDLIPKESMLMMEMEGHRKVAVRPSGTEPKIKYYMFAAQRPDEGQKFAVEEVHEIRGKVADSLESLWEWLKADADKRA